MSQDQILLPFPSEEVPWTEWSDVPRFAVRYRHLTRAALGDDYQIGVAIEVLPAGMQTAPAHYHMLEEEHVYILEGALTVRIGADRYEMKAGDYVCFPAGQKAGHCLINTGSAPCRYVVVGERNVNDVVVYTDSNKVLLRGVGRTILDLAARRDYWDGENTGLPPGVAPPEDGPNVPATSPVKPKPPISSKDVEWNEEGPGRGTRFGGRSRHLTYAAIGGEYRVGMLIESPAPGRRLWPKHYHMVEEEQVLVLEGDATLLLGDERYAMKAGDYVCFPAGRTVGHSFMNSGTGPCSYLMIGSHNPLDVCVYPDSGKLAVNGLRAEASIFDMAALRRYWDGEDIG